MYKQNKSMMYHTKCFNFESHAKKVGGVQHRAVYKSLFVKPETTLTP